MDYITRVLDEVKTKNADQPEFIQAVEEVLESLRPVIEAHPEYEKQAILEINKSGLNEFKPDLSQKNNDVALLMLPDPVLHRYHLLLLYRLPFHHQG